MTSETRKKALRQIEQAQKAIDKCQGYMRGLLEQGYIDYEEIAQNIGEAVVFTNEASARIKAAGDLI